MLDATLSAVRASAKPLSVLFKYYTYTEYPAPTIFISPQHQESFPHGMQDNVVKVCLELQAQLVLLTESNLNSAWNSIWQNNASAATEILCTRKREILQGQLQSLVIKENELETIIQVVFGLQPCWLQHVAHLFGN